MTRKLRPDKIGINCTKSRFSGWFVLVGVLATLAVCIVVSASVTQAQRPDREEMRNQRDGGPGGPGGFGGGRGMNPTSIIDNSWTDLTFAVKVDDRTLIKARPVYQKHRNNLEKTMKETRESGDFQAIRGAMTEIRDAFKADLKGVLTEDQIAQLDKLEAGRTQQMMRRDGGEGGGRPGGGER